MVTVEFIDLKIADEPRSVLSLRSRAQSLASITEQAVESLPYNILTS